MRDILKFGLILMVYSLVASAALAFVNIKTMPRVKLNKIKAKNAARSEVLPDMNGDTALYRTHILAFSMSLANVTIDVHIGAFCDKVNVGICGTFIMCKNEIR